MGRQEGEANTQRETPRSVTPCGTGVRPPLRAKLPEQLNATYTITPAVRACKGAGGLTRRRGVCHTLTG